MTPFVSSLRPPPLFHMLIRQPLISFHLLEVAFFTFFTSGQKQKKVNIHCSHTYSIMRSVLQQVSDDRSSDLCGHMVMSDHRLTDREGRKEGTVWCLHIDGVPILKR